MLAVVVEFDEARGLGRLACNDGETLEFHCLAIAGGGRTIAVGTVVEADRAVGQRGHDEATRVTPLSDPG